MNCAIPCAPAADRAHLMRDLLGRFAAVPLALAAYNAGPERVARCMCVPSDPRDAGLHHEHPGPAQRRRRPAGGRRDGIGGAIGRVMSAVAALHRGAELLAPPSPRACGTRCRDRSSTVLRVTDSLSAMLGFERPSAASSATRRSLEHQLDRGRSAPRRQPGRAGSFGGDLRGLLLQRERLPHSFGQDEMGERALLAAWSNTCAHRDLTCRAAMADTAGGCLGAGTLRRAPADLFLPASRPAWPRCRARGCGSTRRSWKPS